MCLFVLSSGCSTVTISQKGTNKIATEPNYEESYPFFFWGLLGESVINVKEVCAGKEPRQMQTQYTALDCLLMVVTIGIYSPRSAKIWCMDKGQK